MCNQAADGLETVFILGVTGMYVDIEMFVDALDRRIPTHPEATVSQTVDVAFILVDIEFVLDFSDDFLKNVFNGDQAG